MKRIIRNSVFETNSSSTHSLTIVSKEEYEAWERGEVLFNKWSDKFVPPKSEASDTSDDSDEDDCDEDEDENELMTHKQFFDMDNYETFCSEHTTKSGDVVVAFGFHGWGY